MLQSESARHFAPRRQELDEKMPRLPRINVEGAIYYVTSKAEQGNEIFRNREDYQMYLDLVKKYKSQHNFRLYSYCLMPGRLDLLIETGDDLPRGQAGASISEIMHDLNSLYTKYFNGRYHKRGHLFESRFRSVLVEKCEYLAAVSRQIHRVPTAPKDYPYSSFQVYIHGSAENVGPEMASEVEEVEEFLRKKDSAVSYEKYVLEGDSKEIAAFGKTLGRGQVLGSESFQQFVTQKVESHVEGLKEAAAGKPSPTVLFLIGGLVLLVTASSVYLYISKERVETRYTLLLKEKEQEFSEKSRFENRSPLALTELDGTSWSIDSVALPAGKSEEVLHDTFHFAEGLFWSEGSVALGFMPVRYTLLVRPGSITTWEAQQSDGHGNVMTWRGDWQGDVMKGVSRHAVRGKEPQVFSFYSTGWSYKTNNAVMGVEGGAK